MQSGDVTHVRRPGDQHAFCGIGVPNESLSLRHWQIAASTDVDIIVAGIGKVPVDRADAIRDGVNTLPHPVCTACAALASRKDEPMSARRIIYALEEFSLGEGWYPIYARHDKEDVAHYHARWPDTLANPKRVVAYVPQQVEAAQDAAAKEALQKLDQDITVLEVEQRAEGLKVTLLFGNLEEAKAVLEPHR